MEVRIEGLSGLDLGFKGLDCWLQVRFKGDGRSYGVGEEIRAWIEDLALGCNITNVTDTCPNSWNLART